MYANNIIWKYFSENNIVSLITFLWQNSSILSFLKLKPLKIMLYFRYEKHHTQKRNKQKVTRSLPKLNDLPVFEPHHSSNCSVCRCPRKRPPPEESGNKESTPKRQVTSHVTRSMLDSLSPVSTSQSLVNISVLESSGLSGKSISTPHQNSISILLDSAVAGPSNLSNSYVSDSNLTQGKIVEDTLLEENEVQK